MSADHGNNEVWNRSFSETARNAQAKEDSDAWYAVTGLLLAIVTIGVTLAAFTVFVVSRYSGV